MLRILQQFILTAAFAVFASQASAMFIQADWFDPSDPAVGTNRYAYSHNDPINLADPGGNVPYNPGGSTSTGYHNQDTDYETHTSWTDHRSPDYERHNYGDDYGGGGVSYGVHTATGPANYDGRSQGIGVSDGDRDRTDFRSSGDTSQYSSYDYSNPGASGQAMSADGALYTVATLPIGIVRAPVAASTALYGSSAPRVFWSGTTAGRSVMDDAAAMAAQNGMKTLEMTRAGRALTEKLWRSEKDGFPRLRSPRG